MTLTIEPGVVVKFNNGAGLTVNGTLKAEGTADKKIIFTSIWDDTYGGNTDFKNYGTIYPTEPGRRQYTSGGSTYTAYNFWDGYKLWLEERQFGYKQCDLEIWRIFHYHDGYPVHIGIGEQQRNIIFLWIWDKGDKRITDDIRQHNFEQYVWNIHFFWRRNLSEQYHQRQQQLCLYYSGTALIDATYCDWGDPSGPNDPSDDRATGGLYNPNGKGNKVSDHVNYVPWGCSLQVSLAPLGAITAGAQWQVDGGLWQNSGATLTGLSEGVMP